MSKSPKSVADLKGARYNPRVITPLQLKRLQSSLEKFGDLSGVVFNVVSGVLISGHQRMKTVKGKKTRIVKTLVSKKPDSQGTMAVGHIEVLEPDGSTTKIPYREVAWKDRLSEKAANVAANAAGGEFDQAKLGAILAELEQAKFPIEETGVDNFTTAKAIGKFKKSREETGSVEPSGKSRGRDSDYEDSAGSFGVVDPNAMQFAHCCPKCGYQWGEPGKETKAPMAKNAKRSRVEPEVDNTRERVVRGSHKPKKVVKKSPVAKAKKAKAR
jgi:hypothetical protein